ncbi:UNVERIFIED_CONTAM: Retrovirus-related Pol polyprotein from transposon RE2 [Sesamum indicum]
MADIPTVAEDQYQKDVLYLHPSDNSSFVLPSTPLIGSNYLTWSRPVYVALGCKMKLAFIDGSFPKPPAVEAFMYVSSSRELWLEIQTRYGRSSAPMIYQIHREISSISQGDMTLTSYLTKIRKLWNELFCLSPSPKCTCGGCNCGINKAIGEMYSSMQLMQFLMGLHENFDKEKSKLLMLDPLPDPEKVFSMVFAVEQQRNVQIQLTDNTNNSAYQVTLRENRREGIHKQMQKWKPFVDKRSMVCTHCHKTGHLRDTCFQLHGTPEWFKTLNDKKRQPGGNFNFSGNLEARAVNKMENLASNSEKKYDVTDLVAELLKLVKQKEEPSDPISHFTNYVQYEEQFAGNTLEPSVLNISDWIIDLGATNHVCASLSGFESYSIPSYTHFVHLPDGTKTTVSYIGVVRITDKLSLTSKGYRVYDLEDHTLFTSRDVIFHEEIFPYDDNSFKDTLDCPLPTVTARTTFFFRSNSVSRMEGRDGCRDSSSGKKSHLDTNTSSTWQASIGSKWMFKTKLRADGRIERHKACLIAKGYNQVEGVNFTESFFPVTKAVTVRLFLALAATKGWVLQQLDVNNAFLHGYLDEDIYVLPPAGYNVDLGLVCKLERSLYGLKQASHQWNVELTLKLQQFGFTQCAHDHYLFLLHTERGLISLFVYVDDILLAGNCVDELQRVKSYLHNLSTIKDMGDAHYFLGLEIARNSDGIYLSQTKYVLDIITDTSLLEAKSVATPFPAGLKLASDTGALLQTPDSYRRLVGRLLYLSFTRPNISHSVQQLSQYLNHPCDAHWNTALHVVRYLKGCPSLGFLLPVVNYLDLQGYCDVDWASCSDSRRSLTGFCIFLGGALISWKTKKQSTVSRSSEEAEYRSLAATVCELRWLSFLLEDFGVSLSLLVSLFCDNKTALHILANSVFHECTKHIEIDCHLVRDAYKAGFIAPVLIRSFT